MAVVAVVWFDVFNVCVFPVGPEYSGQTYTHPSYTSYSDAWRFTNSTILGEFNSVPHFHSSIP